MKQTKTKALPGKCGNAYALAGVYDKAKKKKTTRANTPPQFTLVQHSAAAFKGDPRFARAVEVCMLHFPTEIREVRMAGGILFDTYVAALTRAHAENYPADVQGLIPRCDGQFDRNKVQGLRIYLAP